MTVIEEQSKQIAEEFLQPLNENEMLSNRIHIDSHDRERSDGEFQRDYTRILYSSSFRRLQGKMQLFAVQNDQFIRNRLTHSLEVAQIARSIASKIGYGVKETYVVEACSLAHDIGNPPFGHAGERFMNELCKDFGGFEGNAQTFRILTTVEQKRSGYQGLNLTYRTLLGVLKYYNKYKAENQCADKDMFKKQKFIYDKDFELVKEIVDKTGVQLRTLDVQIVDLADEIAYAAHDLEDGLRLRVFSADEIIHDFYNEVKDPELGDTLEGIFKETRDNAKKVGYKDENVESSEMTKLYIKEVASRIINLLISDIGIVELSQEQRIERGTIHEKELGFVNYGKLASGLKKTIYKCSTHNDAVYAYEAKGEHMIKRLFDFYTNNSMYLPPEYRAENILKQYPDNYPNIKVDINNNLYCNLQKRLVADYISGMMDQYVKTAYKKLHKIM